MYAQKYNQCKQWISNATGGIDFNYNPPISIQNIDLHSGMIAKTNCHLCDSLGNLVLYGGGGNLYRYPSGDTLLHPGDWFYYGSATGFIDYVFHIKDGLRSAILLPQPGNDSMVYYLNTTSDITTDLDDTLRLMSIGLHYSTVNMNADGGKGAILYPYDIPMLEQNRYDFRGINAVRHGNGTDWWVVLRGLDSAYYDFLLLDATGLHFDHRQYIGHNYYIVNGDLGFSQDGTRFFINWCLYNEVFRFNRCMGMFYDPIFFVDYFNEGWCGEGCTALSSNNRYLYAGGDTIIKQYDLEAGSAAAIEASVQLVGIWSWPPPAILGSWAYPCKFGGMRHGPDGKIYIGNISSGYYCSVINSPNEAGALCDFGLHTFYFDTIVLPWGLYWRTVSAFPNEPNFALGADTCYVGIGDDAPLHELGIAIHPNPTSTQFTLTSDTEISEVQVLDVSGKVLLVTQATSIDVSHFAAGVYLVQVHDTQGRRGVKKLVVN
jgi:hypothetical protein